MYWHNLILSDQRGYKLQRHFLFWTARLLFVNYGILLNYFTMNPDQVSLGVWLTQDEQLFRLQMVLVKFFLEVLYCYAAIYWLLPKYLSKEKYGRFTLGLALISILNNSLLHLYLFWVLPVDRYPGFFEMTQSIFSNFITWIGFPICILLIAYKMLKAWYQKEEEKKALNISNTNAELLLLKAQVHPHFLFNTLNNIYSFTLNKSPLAGELVTKLSHILRYMTKECEGALVQLDNELKILNDYIGLEKVRYGNLLDLHVKITGDPKNKLIAPLLMTPFIENSFKHGASRMLEHPWIKLNINISDEQIFFSVSNSKPLLDKSAQSAGSSRQLIPTPLMVNGKGGLGLNNAKRRLELLYPTSHQLKIESEENVFSVEMVIALEKKQMPFELVGLHDKHNPLPNFVLGK